MRLIVFFSTMLLIASVAHGTERPNVILIMADDLGYEGLACNGGTSYETPVFDRLARQGMRFTHCYSQPICTPSRNKIMTGRSNARNYRSFGNLDPNEITFGSLMRDAGYRTAIAGKWQLTGGGGLHHGDGTTPKKCGFEQSCMWAYQRDVTAEQADAYFANFPDLIEFSDFLPTIVEAGHAKLPTDRPIDGRSFLARLKGEPYTPRESAFVHYDKSPDKEEPEFRRVRFAFDGRYKLYLDGRMFDVPSDFEEEHLLELAAAKPEVIAAREQLQSVLDAMPPWNPDNSVFKGEPDEQTCSRMKRLAELRAN